jgi:hypothetical protein
VLRNVLVILATLGFATLGIVLSFLYLDFLLAVTSCIFIVVVAAIALYFNRQTETKSLSATAVATIAGLTGTNPFWAKLLASQSQVSLPDAFGGLIGSFSITTAFGVLGIVAVVWLDTRDKTISGRKAGSLADELEEIGFDDKLIRMAQILEARLTSLDEETNWTDQAFTPLDAEIEKVSLTGGRPRQIVDLITAIRRDHRSKGFLILGDPGSGKSVAMRRLAREMLKEVPKTLVLPIYVNLKEWTGSHKFVMGNNEGDVFRFVVDFLKLTGNDLIIEFCDTYMRRLLEVGRLFIILDSFDETPVLLDQDETSDAIVALSKGIEEFMIGPHKSRCIVASRYFRRPRFFSTQVSILEILPMSDRKIRQLLIKSNRLTKTEIDNFFRSRTQWLSYAKNPFVANLIVTFIASNDGRLPQNKIEVYDNYIVGRLTRLSSMLEKYDLTIPQIIHIATLVSYEMFSVDEVGLEVDLDELRSWLERKYGQAGARKAIDILIRARLARCSPYPEQRVSFVHRRFNEYFLALAAKANLIDIDPESIITDRRDRDALVLYVELADDHEARAIVQFCWDEIRAWVGPEGREEKGGHDGSRGNDLRVTYCLRFLVDAFTSSKKYLVADVCAGLSEFLDSAVNRHTQNMLGAKIAVEAAGILSDKDASAIVYIALRTGNYWIMETAVRGARNIRDITLVSWNLICRHIWSMRDKETLRKRRDLCDLFRLSPPFRWIPLMINLKVTLIVVQVPIRILALILLPKLYLFALLIQVYFIATPLFVISFIALFNKRLQNLVKNRILRVFDFFFAIDACFLVALLSYIVVLVGSDIFGVFGGAMRRSLLSLGFDINIPVAPFALVAGSVGVRYWAAALTILASPAAYLRATYAWIVRAVDGISWRGVAIATAVIFAAAASIVLLAFLLKFLLQYSIFEYVFAAAMVCFGVFFLGASIWSTCSELYRAISVPDSKFGSRPQIEDLLHSFAYAYMRLYVVQKIEGYHRKNGSRPTGIWRHGGAPNFADKASIRLSQLDEMWMGLER